MWGKSLVEDSSVVEELLKMITLRISLKNHISNNIGSFRMLVEHLRETQKFGLPPVDNFSRGDLGSGFD